MKGNLKRASIFILFCVLFDNSSSVYKYPSTFEHLLARPVDCPPCPSCFNCLLPEWKCENFGICDPNNGRCKDCPLGFGGDDCTVPLCTPPPHLSLNHRNIHLFNDSRQDSSVCKCQEHWTGLTCNVCQNDLACSSLLTFQSDKDNNVYERNKTCYKGDIIVDKQFRSCEAHLSPLYKKLLGGKKTSVTLTCNNKHEKLDLSQCDFQFWLDNEEAFYCRMNRCLRQLNSINVTYACPTLVCSCLTKSSLCDPSKIVDLTPILADIKGPATLECNGNGTCLIREPQLDNFFSGGIELTCETGQCLRQSQVPGYEPPMKKFSLLSIFLVSFLVILVLALLLTCFVYMMRQQRDYMDLDKQPLIPPEEETRLLMESHTPSKVVFHNLSYNIGSQFILHSVSGTVAPGQILAIMGGSGSGKTSTLDILAGKSKKGEVLGDILINGEKLSPKFHRSMMGYVDQEDNLLGTLTVRETLTYSALLRLPQTMSLEAKKLRVQQTLEELGIDHIADRLVGKSDSRGISGGEKRRLSIAQELVTFPTILFLDEPTSGLDSYNAFNVMQSIFQLARRYNRTIICTIHQPRSDIYTMFDKILLLSFGQMVYSGAASDVPHYLASIGLPCPMGYNMADHLLDLCHNVTDERHSISSGIILDHSASTSSISQTNGYTNSKYNSKNLKDPGLLLKELKDNQAKRKTISFPTAEGLFSDNLKIYLNHLFKTKRHTKLECEEDKVSSKFYLVERRARILSHHFIHSTYGQRFMIDIDKDLISMHPSRYNIQDDQIQPENDDFTHRHSGLEGLKQKQSDKASFWNQVKILSGRTFINLYRNPYLLLAHYGLSLILACSMFYFYPILFFDVVFCGGIFYNVSDDMPGVQNRMGCLFFICAFFAFGSLTSLEFFATERILFIRERSNGYYFPFAYYLSKVFFDLLPLRTIPPLLFGTIVYYLVGFVPNFINFGKFLLVLVLFNLVSAAICLVIAVGIKHSALGNLIATLTILFSMLFGGFLLNKEQLPFILSWIKYLSVFNYAYEAIIVNELSKIQLHDDTIVDIDIPGTLILKQFGFSPNAYWRDVIILSIMFFIALSLAFFLLKFLVREKK